MTVPLLHAVACQGGKPAPVEMGTAAAERTERVHRYERAFTVPTTVDASTIKATYEHGVLTATLPKAKKAKPREIAVQMAAKEGVCGVVQPATAHAGAGVVSWGLSAAGPRAPLRPRNSVRPSLPRRAPRAAPRVARATRRRARECPAPRIRRPARHERRRRGR